MSRKLLNWLSYHPEIDIYNTDHVYCGQFKTLRYPPHLLVDELVGIITDRDEPLDDFYVSGRVFRVYNNMADRYDTTNFLLINVGFEPYRFPLKICFDKLKNPNLVGETVRFTCKRIKTDLFLLDYDIITHQPEYLADLFQINLTE